MQPTLNAGDVFGRYRIIEKVGGGGMGEVYKAQDGRETRALKILRSDLRDLTHNLKRFAREVELAKKVSHPNVCGVYETGEVDGLRYIAMEFIDGQTLADFIRAVEGLSQSGISSADLRAPTQLGPVDLSSTEAGLSPWQAVRIAKQICEGLAAIHTQGIVHRDLKPSNVVLTRDGRILVVDFGLAYHPEADPVTATGEVLGTLAYMAPEQTKGQKTDARSDIYALGLILFEMLTGRAAPGDGGRIPLALRQGEGCPPPSKFARDVSPKLDALVKHCLEQNPANRYATADELSTALTAAETSLAAPRAETTTTKRTKSKWLLGAATAAAIVASIGLFNRQGPEGKPPTFSRPYYLAVAPFENRSADLGDALARGFTDAVLSRLSTMNGISVVPTGADTGAPIELRASMQQDDSTIRVSYQLSGTHGSGALGPLAGDVLDASSDSLFELQDRIAASVASNLGEILDEDFLVRFPTRPTENLQAYGLYLQAQAALQARNEQALDDAEASFREALEADSNFVLAQSGLCEVQWQRFEQLKETKWVEPAEIACQRALAADDTIAEVHIALARIYRNTARPPAALSSYRRALELDPRNSDAVRGLANLYESQGQLDLAEQTYRDAIAMRPEYWRGYADLGRFFFLNGKLSESEEEFQKVTRITPSNSNGYRNIGAVQLVQGKYQEAEDNLRLSIEIRPTAIALGNLATSHYFQGEFAEAATEFEKALAINDTDYRIWGNLADARTWAPELRNLAGSAYQKSIEIAEERLRINPQEVSTLRYMATCHAKLGDFDSARSRIEQARDLLPRDRTVMFNAAIVYELAGDRTNAANDLVEALRLGLPREIVDREPFLQGLRESEDFQSKMESLATQESEH